MSFDDLVNKCNGSARSKFGVPAVISQPGQPDKPVTVIFDQTGYVEQGIITDKPQIAIPEPDLTGLDLKYTTITVTGKYPEARILKPLPDGAGWIVATLTKA